MLSGFFQDGSLVPVFGAGFTVGEIAASGCKVPKGEQFKALMLEQLEQFGLTSSELETLKGEKFSEVCDIYFDPEIVPTDAVKKTLQNQFLDVSLSTEKQSLLNDIDWKYIYTLNIDNAIERHSKFRPVYPYDSGLSHKSRDFNPVYKLHGDVYYEVTHSTDRLVFRKASYLESIETNSRMLSLLEEDLLNKNIIYIGCSLSDEDDIAFLVAAKNIPGRKITRRIIFCSKEPGRIELLKYKRHGINTIILTDKGQYSQPYRLIQSAYLKSAESDKELERFIFKLKHLSADPEENKTFLIKGVTEVGREHGNNLPILPNYYANREKEREILDAILKAGIVIVSGPRVSGKTLATRSIAGNIKDRKVLFIESGTTLEPHYLNKIMGLQNTLIVFDAKTIDTELGRIIRGKSNTLKDNNTTALCIIDSGDGILIDTLSTSKLSPPHVIEIDRKFSTKELKDVNAKFKKVRCPTFKPGRKLLDNLFMAYRILGQDSVIKKIPKEKDLLALLYVISVKRKIDGDWVRFISSSHERLDELIAKCIPYLEYEKVWRSELASHAGYKVICNSDAWLLSVTFELYKSRGVTWCIDCLFELVRNIPQEESRLSIELTLFDNLNFAFAGDTGGAAELILGFYEKLEEIRGSEAEFFVQKAKAYYNMYRQKDVVEKLNERLNELIIAETWAQSEHDEAAQRNIRHISALISLRRTHENSHTNIEHAIDAIHRTWKALSEEHSNSEYVNKLAEGSLRGSEYLAGLLIAIDNSKIVDPRILQLKDKINFIKSRILASA
ncbi:SIR2-like domain protein [compost metagenome]